MLPHLSELHGAATHLAVVAIPLYALLLPPAVVTDRNFAAIVASLHTQPRGSSGR